MSDLLEARVGVQGQLAEQLSDAPAAVVRAVVLLVVPEQVVHEGGEVLEVEVLVALGADLCAAMGARGYEMMTMTMMMTTTTTTMSMMIMKGSFKIRCGVQTSRFGAPRAHLGRKSGLLELARHEGVEVGVADLDFWVASVDQEFDISRVKGG